MCARIVINLLKKKSLLIFLGVETLIALLVIYGLTFGQAIGISPLIPLPNAFHEMVGPARIEPTYLKYTCEAVFY